MTEKHWVILGAGTVGQEAARIAIEIYNARVTIVEPNQQQAQKVVNRLKKCLGKDIPIEIVYELSDTRIFDEKDVAVSCAPHRFNYGFTRRAINAKIPFCDLGGHNQTVIDQRKLVKEFNPSTSVVPDCGVDPGIVNSLALYQVSLGCNMIQIYCGGNPLVPPRKDLNRYRSKNIFNPQGIAAGYCGTVFQIHGGKIVEIPALSYVHRYDETYEYTPTANNSRLVTENFLECGVQELACDTLRYHGHVEAMKQDAPLHNKDMFEGWLRAKAELQFNPERHDDRMTIIVEGSHTDGDRWRPQLKYEIVSDRSRSMTAMGRATALGISLVANELAHGRGPWGFSLPEEFIDPTLVFQMMEREAGRLPSVAA